VLTQDLAQLHKLFDLVDIVSTPVGPNKVKAYYNAITARTYKLLQIFRGPGLHSTLCLPAPILRNAGTSVQPLMVLEKICKSSCKSVLEIGCGQGYCTQLLAVLCPDVVFKGIDVLDQHIEVAKQCSLAKCYENTEFAVCDACTLDAFEGQTFDLIFAVEALCYLDNSQKRNDFITCASKRLNQGGYLVIIDGFRSSAFEETSPEQQMAMRIAERGFQINEMPTKSAWKSHASDLNFHMTQDLDLTAEVLPFCQQAWRVARFILNFTYLIRMAGMCSATAKKASANLLAAATTAHAFRNRGAAEYGMLTLQMKTEAGSMSQSAYMEGTTVVGQRL